MTKGLTKKDAWFAARHIWGETLKLRPDLAQCGLKVYPSPVGGGPHGVWGPSGGEDPPRCFMNIK